MSRRKYYLTRHCAHPGCKETATYEYATKRDYMNGYERECELAGRPWYCLRHDPNRGHVTPDNPNLRMQVRLESYQNDSLRPEHRSFITYRFWVPEGQGPRGGCGSATLYDPHWHCDAGDFPPGTRLEITLTVRAILPDGGEEGE